jgi:hypothetical protein
MARDMASYLSTLSDDDKLALRGWASNARLEVGGKILLGGLKMLGW